MAGLCELGAGVCVFQVLFWEDSRQDVKDKICAMEAGRAGLVSMESLTIPGMAPALGAEEGGERKRPLSA